MMSSKEDTECFRLCDKLLINTYKSEKNILNSLIISKNSFRCSIECKCNNKQKFKIKQGGCVSLSESRKSCYSSIPSISFRPSPFPFTSNISKDVADVYATFLTRRQSIDFGRGLFGPNGLGNAKMLNEILGRQMKQAQDATSGLPNCLVENSMVTSVLESSASVDLLNVSVSSCDSSELMKNKCVNSDITRNIAESDEKEVRKIESVSKDNKNEFGPSSSKTRNKEENQKKSTGYQVEHGCVPLNQQTTQEAIQQQNKLQQTNLHHHMLRNILQGKKELIALDPELQSVTNDQMFNENFNWNTSGECNEDIFAQINENLVNTRTKYGDTTNNNNNDSSNRNIEKRNDNPAVEGLCSHKDNAAARSCVIGNLVGSVGEIMNTIGKCSEVKLEFEPNKIPTTDHSFGNLSEAFRSESKNINKQSPENLISHKHFSFSEKVRNSELCTMLQSDLMSNLVTKKESEGIRHSYSVELSSRSGSIESPSNSDINDQSEELVKNESSLDYKQNGLFKTACLDMKRARVENIVTSIQSSPPSNLQVHLQVNGCKKRKLYQPQQHAMDRYEAANAGFNSEINTQTLDVEEEEEDEEEEQIESPQIYQKQVQKNALKSQLRTMQEQLAEMQQKYVVLCSRMEQESEYHEVLDEGIDEVLIKDSVNSPTLSLASTLRGTIHSPYSNTTSFYPPKSRKSAGPSIASTPPMLAEIMNKMITRTRSPFVEQSHLQHPSNQKSSIVKKTNNTYPSQVPHPVISNAAAMYLGQHFLLEHEVRIAKDIVEKNERRNQKQIEGQYKEQVEEKEKNYKILEQEFKTNLKYSKPEQEQQQTVELQFEQEQDDQHLQEQQNQAQRQHLLLQKQQKHERKDEIENDEEGEQEKQKLQQQQQQQNQRLQHYPTQQKQQHYQQEQQKQLQHQRQEHQPLQQLQEKPHRQQQHQHQHQHQHQQQQLQHQQKQQQQHQQLRQQQQQQQQQNQNQEQLQHKQFHIEMQQQFQQHNNQRHQNLPQNAQQFRMQPADVCPYASKGSSPLENHLLTSSSQQLQQQPHQIHSNISTNSSIKSEISEKFNMLRSHSSSSMRLSGSDLEGLAEILKSEITTSLSSLVDTIVSRFVHQRRLFNKQSHSVVSAADQLSKDLMMASQILERKSPRSKAADQVSSCTIPIVSTSLVNSSVKNIASSQSAALFQAPKTPQSMTSVAAVSLYNSIGVVGNGNGTLLNPMTPFSTANLAEQNLEQNEALSLVITPKKKRHKVTDTRITPRTVSRILAQDSVAGHVFNSPDLNNPQIPNTQPNIFLNQKSIVSSSSSSMSVTLTSPKTSKCSSPHALYHPPGPPTMSVTLPTTVAIPNPSLHESEVFSPYSPYFNSQQGAHGSTHPSPVATQMKHKQLSSSPPGFGGLQENIDTSPLSHPPAKLHSSLLTTVHHGKSPNYSPSVRVPVDVQDRSLECNSLDIQFDGIQPTISFLKQQILKTDSLPSLHSSTLTPMHLRKAKLMFFWVRYPSSAVLKIYFPDIKFNKNNTAQLVKWFSNFREFYYIQMEKYARQAVTEGLKNCEELHVGSDSELYRVLNLHYNRNNHIEVPSNFRFVVEQTLREFFRAIKGGKDTEQSWKKSIYKIISRMDDPVPEYFKSPNFLEQLE